MVTISKPPLLALAVIMILMVTHPSSVSSSQRLASSAVLQLIGRVLPGREREFAVTIDSDANKLDTFEFYTVNKTFLQISATTGVAAAWGFNHYLKYFCKAHISWSGSQLLVPTPLPIVEKVVKISSPNRFRYYQNVCTSSYSYVWWNWTRWEKEIDWMALNGINLPLAFTGQEEIWRRVYIKLGVSQKDLDGHFAGPAFLAWGRMGNVRGWAGPLPYPAWYSKQLSLQHQILTRMRALGMKPVLPGFAGHVPSSMKQLYPSANISRLGDWGKFNSTYCCTHFLDPNDSLFQKIGSMFIEEQIKEYNGTDHIYNADSFNEMTPPSSEPSYLASSSRSILNAMEISDPNAVWLMQGWLFQDKSFWKPTQIKALLTGVPIGKMIVLDLFAEVHPIWRETESFYGQPFIWCMLHNFGGNHGLYGTVQRITEGPLEAHSDNASTIIGTGMAPEGIEQNDFIYDLMSEMGWRSEKFDLFSWADSYVERRYGSPSNEAKIAWRLLLSSVYNCTDNHADHNHGIPVVRPTSLNLRYSVWYDLTKVIEAWKYLLSCSKELSQSETYRYDLVDVGRQVLQDVSYSFYVELINGYRKKDTPQCKTAADSLLNLLGDLDKLLSSDRHFLLGTWLEAAKAFGTSEAETALYEFNARNQITMWGPDDNIHDYANKMWGGLMDSYYLQRWRMFCDALLRAVESGKTIDLAVFKSDILKFERKWNGLRDLYPTRPYGDTLSISKALYERYSKAFGGKALESSASLVNTREARGRSYSFVRQN